MVNLTRVNALYVIPWLRRLDAILSNSFKIFIPFLETNRDKKQKNRSDGIKIYENVTIEFPKFTQNGKKTQNHKRQSKPFLKINVNMFCLFFLTGISYAVHFDVEKLKFVQWSNSRRLTYGNLVCFSSDNFKVSLVKCHEPIALHLAVLSQG